MALGIDPVAIVTGSTVVAKLFGGIFGGGETREEEFARHMREWQSKMTTGQWQFFVWWINERAQKNDWAQACPDRKNHTGSYGPRDRIFYTACMANDILKLTKCSSPGCPRPHCRTDWMDFDPVQALVAIQSQQAAAKVSPSMAGFDLNTILLVGGIGLAMVLLLGRR
jgi:hypothetical protein